MPRGIKNGIKTYDSLKTYSTTYDMPILPRYSAEYRKIIKKNMTRHANLTKKIAKQLANCYVLRFFVKFSKKNTAKTVLIPR